MVKSGTASAQSETEHSNNDLRVAWVRVHPAAFNTAFVALQKAASDVLAELTTTNGHHSDVVLTDLRGQINAFDLIGPLSSHAIRRALCPSAGDKAPEKDEVGVPSLNLISINMIYGQFWKAMRTMGSSACIPKGTTVGLTVDDPRVL